MSAVNKRRLSSLGRKDTNMQADRQSPDGKKQHMAVSREKKIKTQLGLKRASIPRMALR